MKLQNIDDAELRKALNRIAETGKLAADVISSLRMLTQQTEPRFREVDLDELIREVLVLARGEIERCGISLETHLDPEALRISGDKVQLQQVFLNVITNAVDAMSETTNRPRILRISSSAGGQELIITVDDTGPGIKGDIAEKAFESFFSTKADGMGLGLSICRSIITNHMGRIWAVTRADGQGAEFKIAIPLQASHVGPNLDSPERVADPA
jgi:signal transduction histidine kinase